MFFRFQIPELGINISVEATDKAAAIRKVFAYMQERGIPLPSGENEITAALDRGEQIKPTDIQGRDVVIREVDQPSRDGEVRPPDPALDPNEFRPGEGIGATGFAPFALTEALRTRGIDTSRPGQGFLGSLFPEARATEAIGSVLGGGFEGPTLSPFANFVLGTLGTGGGRTLGNQAASILANLAESEPSRILGSISPERQAETGFTDAQGNPLEGDVLANIFQSPTSLNSNTAQAVSDLASAALLQRLSPSAFSLFGQQLVGEANRQFGNLTAQGRAPTNRVAFLREALRI